MTNFRRVKTDSTYVLAAGIGLLSVLTALTLYVFASHHFLSLRPSPHIIYADALPSTQIGVIATVDTVSAGSATFAFNRGPIGFRVSARQPIELRGWLVDSIARAPALGVLVRTDFVPPFGAVYGLRRPDVAAAVCPMCTNSGFSISFDAQSIPTGVHSLWICAIRAAGDTLFVPPKPIRFIVTR